MRAKLVESKERRGDEIRWIILNGRSEDLRDLFKNSKLDEDTIEFAIEEGRRELDSLYRYQELTQRNIKTAITKSSICDSSLQSLYIYQKLNDENVKLAILRRTCLHYLAHYQDFSDENTKLYIERAKKPVDLAILYNYQRLSLENIKRALLKHYDFEPNRKKELDKRLYRYQIPKLTASEREEIEDFIAIRGL